MTRYIVKLGTGYVVWSTIVDAPITSILTRDELENWIRICEGLEGIRALPERMKRVDKTGTSAMDTTREEILSCNRAGDEGQELSEGELVEQYAGVMASG